MFDRYAFTAKCFLAGLFLTTLICIPYLLYSDDVARWSQSLLSAQYWQVLVALLVLILLVLDIVLPMPSSLVCITAYALLDGWIAFLVVTIGLTLTYVVGHVLGATAGLTALQRIFTAEEFAKLQRMASGQRYTAIVLSRPLPVLAEGTSIYIGAIGTPLLSASMCALLSSVGVAFMYGWIAHSAKGQDSVWLALLASMILPALFWFASIALRKNH